MGNEQRKNDYYLHLLTPHHIALIKNMSFKLNTRGENIQLERAHIIYFVSYTALCIEWMDWLEQETRMNGTKALVDKTQHTAHKTSNNHRAEETQSKRTVNEQRP